LFTAWGVSWGTIVLRITMEILVLVAYFECLATITIIMLPIILLITKKEQLLVLTRY
jgi:hypothetical protein